MTDLERQKAQREMDARTYEEGETFKVLGGSLGIILLGLAAVGMIGYWLLSLI